MNIISTGSICWKILKSFRKGESRFVVGYFIYSPSKLPHMSNTPDLSRVVFTRRRIESDFDRNREWAQGAWSVVPEVKG